MRRRVSGRVFLAACVLLALAGGGPAAERALAQEGHPLTGTWVGEWTSPAGRTRVTLVMTWDGTEVSGIMNPGPDAAPLTRVSADWTNWTVRIEATAKDTSGNPAAVVAEGTLEDIGSSHRKISGTWTQAGTKGDFTLTRE